MRLPRPFFDPAASTGTDAEILKEFREVRDLIKSKARNWVGDSQDESG